MTRILNKFNLRKNPYVQATQTNPEGFPSFQRSDQEAYLQVLLTNTLTGTFYAQESELLKESLGLHLSMTQNDPAFAARALVHARSEGLMRLQPIVGLAYLAKANLTLFHKVFSRVIQTPGDLTDFVEIVRGGVAPGGMGRSIKTAINLWLNGLSEYHAIKYATGGQGYSLRDVLRVTHPKPLTPAQDAIFIWLTDAEKWNQPDRRALTPQIDAFEQLKRIETNGSDQAAVRALIAQGRLPYEVVTGMIKPDQDTWSGLMRQMPYMALMRHLNTLQRAGVLAIESNARYVVDRLVSIDALRKAKILPFQLFTAYRNFKAEVPAERLVAEALTEAMDHAFVNLPDLGGAVCIAPDVSGSMSGFIAKGETRYIDIAGIFSGALLKANPQALVLPFENKVIDVQLSARDTLVTTADKLAKIGGGGTAVSAPISQLLDRKIRVDTFIGITDNIEWAKDQSGRLGFLPAWYEYKAKVAPQARAFLLTIAPYRHAVAPQDAADIHTIYGWNDSVLRYIALTLQGLAGQVESVSALEL
ncbi:MAG: TROVE domain-containing protein [Chloroflexi bacterium]|nr:TROVE domain-containing protein [Chloroflexota bacterium]